jgi:hypothetical protein
VCLYESRFIDGCSIGWMVDMGCEFGSKCTDGMGRSVCNGIYLFPFTAAGTIISLWYITCAVVVDT